MTGWGRHRAKCKAEVRITAARGHTDPDTPA